MLASKDNVVQLQVCCLLPAETLTCFFLLEEGQAALLESSTAVGWDLLRNTQGDV